MEAWGLYPRPKTQFFQRLEFASKVPHFISKI